VTAEAAQLWLPEAFQVDEQCFAALVSTPGGTCFSRSCGSSAAAASILQQIDDVTPIAGEASSIQAHYSGCCVTAACQPQTLGLN